MEEVKTAETGIGLLVPNELFAMRWNAFLGFDRETIQAVLKESQTRQQEDPDNPFYQAMVDGCNNDLERLNKWLGE